MLWLKFFAATVDDPRLVRVSAEARWLWVCGRCYITEHLTDGEIHARAVLRSAHLRKPYLAVKALLYEGLWDRFGADNYFDPGWHDAIGSRAEAEATRKQIAARVGRYRRAEAP